jgi:hypothetical protein
MQVEELAGLAPRSAMWPISSSECDQDGDAFVRASATGNAAADRPQRNAKAVPVPAIRATNPSFRSTVSLNDWTRLLARSEHGRHRHWDCDAVRRVELLQAHYR